MKRYDTIFTHMTTWEKLWHQKIQDWLCSMKTKSSMRICLHGVRIVLFCPVIFSEHRELCNKWFCDHVQVTFVIAVWTASYSGDPTSNSAVNFHGELSDDMTGLQKWSKCCTRCFVWRSCFKREDYNWKWRESRYPPQAQPQKIYKLGNLYWR